MCTFKRFCITLSVVCALLCACCGLSVGASDTSAVDEDFVGPTTETTTTTTEPVDYSEDGVFGWIGSKISALGDTISNAFTSVGDTIVEGIKGIFVPEDGYLDEKFNAIKERFAFWESISDTVQVVVNYFETAHWSEPPVVTVNFTNGTSAHGVNYGTSAKILDFSWYEPYKASVDVIISAFLWLFFLWRTYLALPNIIAGVAPQAIFDTYEVQQMGQLDRWGLEDGLTSNFTTRNSERKYREVRALRKGQRKNGH